MLNVALALLATLAAFGGAGLLVSRTLPERRIHQLAWCGTLIALGLALGAMTIGYAAGFRPALLRAIELFGALVAPMALALGIVEVIARTVQARFAARLIAASYVIVAVVILLLDPITGTFGKSLPKVTGHYSSLPGSVLDGAHIFAVVSLVSCVAVTALRSNRLDRQAAETMATLAMVALAGVLIVATTRSYLPGPLAPLALGGAAALIWSGASRLPTNRPRNHDHHHEEPEPYEAMSRHHQPYDDGQHNTGQRPVRRRDAVPPGGHPGGQHTGGNASGSYDTGPRPRPDREAQPSFAPPPGLPTPQAPQAHQAMGQYGRIMIYTLIDGHAEEFDRLAAEVVQAVRRAEPGTLIYACHIVDGSPNQRLFYQLFRDADSVEAHTRQPHVQWFAREARAHVSGTNVLELTVSAGGLVPPDRPPTPGNARPVRWPHG